MSALISGDADIGLMGPEASIYIYNQGEDYQIVMVDRIGEDRCGTGDVISSVIAGSYLNGYSFYESVKRATLFASKCIDYCEKTQVPNYYGLCFEEYLYELGEE